MGISDNHGELRLIRGRLQEFKRHFGWSGGHFHHVEMLEGFMGLAEMGGRKSSYSCKSFNLSCPFRTPMSAPWLLCSPLQIPDTKSRQQQKVTDFSLRVDACRKQGSHSVRRPVKAVRFLFLCYRTRPVSSHTRVAANTRELCYRILLFTIISTPMMSVCLQWNIFLSFFCISLGLAVRSELMSLCDHFWTIDLCTHTHYIFKNRTNVVHGVFSV